MKTKKAIGFISWATYELKNKERICNNVAGMLARFAEYANKGENKTCFEIIFGVSADMQQLCSKAWYVIIVGKHK